MAEDDFLPIKVVLKQDSDDRPYKPRDFKDPEPLGPVTQELRNELVGKVATLQTHFRGSFERWPGVPVVAKVKLKTEAIAKYRRPDSLFNADTCPIIGGGAPTELHASASPQGLTELARRLKSSIGKREEAHISTVVSVDPYSLDDVLRGHSIEEIVAAHSRAKARPLKVRLFRHGKRKADDAISKEFLNLVDDLKVGEVEPLNYAPNLAIYALHGVPSNAIAKVAAFVGLQNLSAFPTYRILRPAARAVASVTATNFPPPDPNREYGIVGIIDSGTDPNNAYLRPWILTRHEHHPSSQQNNDHGSFVAGLAIHPRLLNHNNPLFPEASSRIVDVVAIDKTGGADEYDLHTIIEDSLRRFPQVKIWNMSLAMDGTTCKDDEFSEFAAFLDAKSQQHKVLFHLPTGNFTVGQMRAWPPQGGLGESDRVQPPADSIASLVVGSVAHLESPSSRVRAGQPSPFSRRGPGGAYHIKPELAGYGGNCDGNGNCVQIGVLSLDATGHIAESIGTSYSTPPVASLSASIHQELSVGADVPAPGLVKALQVHGAFLKAGSPDRTLMQYMGVGVPASPKELLSCTPSSATCIFQITVASSPLFVRRGFPIPACLVHDGRLAAEMFMTLYYVPPTDRGYAAEYCRTNVSASLGTVKKSKDEKGKVVEVHSKELPGVPEDYADGWEADLIESGLKWSPLKLYYRHFKKKPVNQDWQLQLTFQSRPEFKSSRKQDVYLIFTVRDPHKSPEVYNQMVREMQRLGWQTSDLNLRSRARYRA